MGQTVGFVDVCSMFVVDLSFFLLYSRFVFNAWPISIFSAAWPMPGRFLLARCFDVISIFWSCCTCLEGLACQLDFQTLCLRRGAKNGSTGLRKSLFQALHSRAI